MAESRAERPVVVTGANGFLGNAVVRLFRKQGQRIRPFYGPPSRFDDPYDRSITRGDICDKDLISSLVAECDTVIHLAGPPSVAASFEDPGEFVRVHAAGTACLLGACVKARVRRFVYVSSAQVYGAPSCQFVSEDHPTEPRSPYAAAKICGEKLAEAYRRSFGLETVVLRPFSIYGRGSSPEAVLNRIVAMARSNTPVALFDLRPVLDYCFVDDVAAALVSASTAPVAGKTFNVGTMRGTSIRELAERVLQMVGRPPEIVEDAANRPPGGASVLRLVADNTRAATELGWSPQKSLDEGLRLLLHAA